VRGVMCERLKTWRIMFVCRRFVLFRLVCSDYLYFGTILSSCASLTHLMPWPGVGCIVDGVPPRMQLTEEEIQVQLDRRRPGQAGAGAISTGRNEADAVQILSGRPEHSEACCCSMAEQAVCQFLLTLQFPGFGQERRKA